MITICRKAFFYEQLKLGKISFFEVPISISLHIKGDTRALDLNYRFPTTVVNPGKNKVDAGHIFTENI